MCLALCLEPWPTRGPGRLPEEEEEEDGQRGAGGVIKGEAKRGWRQIMIITKDDDGWLAAGSSRSGGGRKIPEGEGGGGWDAATGHFWPLLIIEREGEREGGGRLQQEFTVLGLLGLLSEDGCPPQLVKITSSAGRFLWKLAYF